MDQSTITLPISIYISIFSLLLYFNVFEWDDSLIMKVDGNYETVVFIATLSSFEKVSAALLWPISLTILVVLRIMFHTAKHYHALQYRQHLKCVESADEDS